LADVTSSRVCLPPSSSINENSHCASGGLIASAAGIIFTFGSVMDIRVGAMFALFIRRLARLSSFSTALDREIGAAPKLD
jgi:hypothetical protein